MDFMIEDYKVYIKVDENNRITEVNSSAFISDTEGWIEIDSGLGDKYHHAQGNYFDKPIMNFDGTHNYKLVDGAVIETSEEEKAEELASFPKPEPTEIEQLWDSQLEQEFRICCLELGVTTDDIK